MFIHRGPDDEVWLLHRVLRWDSIQTSMVTASSAWGPFRGATCPAFSRTTLLECIGTRHALQSCSTITMPTALRYFVLSGATYPEPEGWKYRFPACCRTTTIDVGDCLDPEWFYLLHQDPPCQFKLMHTTIPPSSIAVTLRNTLQPGFKITTPLVQCTLSELVPQCPDQRRGSSDSPPVALLTNHRLGQLPRSGAVPPCTQYSTVP
jgi:hypothetical protein